MAESEKNKMPRNEFQETYLEDRERKNKAGRYVNYDDNTHSF